MELKPGYKETDVGVIPEDWQVKPLASIVKYTNGKAHEKSITDTGNFVVVNSKFISTEGLIRKFAQTRFCPAEKGDVLMVMSDVPNGRAIAKCFWVDCDDTYTVNQRICVLNPNGVDGKLLYYKLDRNPFYLAFDDGAKQTNLRKEDVLSCPLSIPNTEAEQRAIATALSDVDALLAGLDRLIAKKRAVKQAAMQQLLTGQTRLPGFEEEWEVKRLGELGDVTGSGVDKKSRSDEQPVRIVNYMDVYRRNYIYAHELEHWVTAPAHQVRRCAIQQGDVFFTPSSETRDDIGLSAVAMEDIPDACYSYHIVRLRLREPWDLRFRAYAFQTRGFLSQAEILCDGGGTRYVVSLGKFRNMTVQVPPLQEQTAIATVLSDKDAEIAALEQRSNKTKNIKQAMMQELLTGKTRLVTTGGSNA